LAAIGIAKGTLLQYPASGHILREVEGLQKVTAKVIDGTRLIGYARVSSDDQNLDMQIDALERAGCEVIYKA
jgi:predicted site-specific integrase-resolvase